MSTNIQEDEPLDAIDRTIVDALRADGRISIPMLAERVGISRANAYSRFDRLVDGGTITGFTAQLAPESVGLKVSALALVKADQRAWESVTADLLATPGVQWIGLAAGSFDYVVLLRAADLDDLRDVVMKEVLAVPGIRSTETSVLLDEVRADDALF